MALPKEPRQKMINLMYLVLTALLALNVSSEILNAFKVVDKSLVTSNENITTANNTLYTSLKNKLADPVTAEKAKPWYDKAELAKKLSTDLNGLINQYKIDLKKEAGAKMVEIDGKQVEEFKEDDLEAATRLFGDGDGGKKKGKELESKLKEYREAMLNIDPSIRKEFESTFPVDVSKIIGQDGKEKDFTYAYFHMTPTVAALTLLSKFQNNVKNAENQIVTFCHSQVGAVKVVYDQYVPIVGQSSSYLMPGEEIIITAGVGAFAKSAQPSFNIAGSSVNLGADGMATYKTSVSGSGERSVPVVINYMKNDGTFEKKIIDVKYTVGTPGGSSVAASKMNVFYIGVDNPVKIGSTTGWDKTSVSITNGTISGQGSDRIVKPSNLPGQKCIITVTSDKKAQPFEFRIKEVPPPTFTVGDGGSRMKSVVFKNATACFALPPRDFDFSLTFPIVSFDVIFSGANFPSIKTLSVTGNSLSSLSSLMSLCGPGSSVSFDKVKVKYPDGSIKPIAPTSIVLY